MAETSITLLTLIDAGNNGKILPGATWQLGTGILSNNSEFALVFQTDGNLCIYEVIGDPPVQGSLTFNGRFLQWGPQKSLPNATHIAFQIDGNVCIYGTAGAALWCSNTGLGAPAYFIIQNDANFCSYGYTALTCSGTNQPS